MSYRKVRALQPCTNSVQNLVLRQQFALKFLQLDLSETVVINIDESWLGMSAFRHTKWCLPRETNTVAKLTVQPRITMIVALDSRGGGHLSLLQANSNATTFSTYLQHYIRMLDSARPGWRKNTVLLLDNAPYHRSGAVMKLLREEAVPLLFTGPYSFSAAPVELYFAAFKRADINPRHLPTGKK